MAIPTQFSTARVLTAPIANGKAPIDTPDVLPAESVSIIDGAEVLTSLSGIAMPLPSELTAEVKATIDSAVTVPAEAKATIDTPAPLDSENVNTARAPRVYTTRPGTPTGF